MKKILLSLILVFGFSAAASAQTHPCDASPASVNVKSPFKVQWCWNGKDEDGTPTTATEIKILFDGVEAKTVAPSAPIGSPSATGYSLYQATGVVAPKGAHVLTVVITTVDGDAAPSAPYSFSVIGKPSPATAARVLQ